MTKVRIVCKAPQPTDPGCVILPSGGDMQIILVAEDGTETVATNVRSVEFAASDTNNNEPLSVKLTLTNVELDVEAIPAEELTP